MSWTSLEATVNAAWEDREAVSPATQGDVRHAIIETLKALDCGEFRVSEKSGGVWHTHQWIKKAVLLSFRLNPMERIPGGPGDGCWWDKVPSKFAGWTDTDYSRAGFRAVPGAIVRHSAFIGKGAVLMPSFVNVGAHVGEGTMVDTWATIGSCAQVGRNCHISGGTGVGGVLEPLQANPVIIEDNCFIGARSEVAEGVIVGEGAVVGMGVFLGQSTKIVDRESGQIHYGRVPPYSVVVAGSMGGAAGKPALYCAVIVKTVDERTRSKTSINELLRD